MFGFRFKKGYVESRFKPLELEGVYVLPCLVCHIILTITDCCVCVYPNFLISKRRVSMKKSCSVFSKFCFSFLVQY